MGRSRKSERHLPARVYLEHGAYYYRDGKKPRVQLGRDLGEALAKYATLMAQAWSLRRLGDVIDRYRAEVLPLKRAEQTRLEEGRALDKLKMAFGHMLPDNLTAVHCYGYIDRRRSKEGKPVPVAARHEIALLGHVYRKAKRWGAASINPASGLELPEKAGRRPYVPMEWVEAARGLASPRMRLAIDLAVMIGQRRGDLLKLKFSDVRADGVYVKQGKTGAELLIAMSPALEAILDESKAMAPQIPREYVLRRSNGRPFTASGFASNWQRLMRKHKAAGGDHFTFRDLRSVSVNDTGVEEARDRLGHASGETTKRHYLRGVTKAKPRS
jgi:integrase